ncbi:hypothetical protein QJS10_CPA06g00258 [Acorus calamus]|uniref:Uncharacterized protein n=1 Tax=Acorus calamus TaxID=4465 RepID=A0AAV9EJV7_ACOCL|nr:hypothetical protein QJS10_CPA06g00258 [Acorus calamus]
MPREKWGIIRKAGSAMRDMMMCEGIEINNYTLLPWDSGSIDIHHIYVKGAYMKPESLVISGQPYGGEFVPGPCTLCPSHYGRWLPPDGRLMDQSTPNRS